MSTEQKPEIKNEATDALWDATLVRGKSYTLRGVRFERDVAKRVANTVKEYLEANAYEEISNGLDGDDEALEKKPKFKFSRVRARAAG